jgi:hypothetical protein
VLLAWRDREYCKTIEMLNLNLSIKQQNLDSICIFQHF